MGVTKDPTTGLWRAQFRYVDWTGQNKKSGKRGFKTKREAEEYIREVKQVKQGSPDMPFSEFVKLYFADLEPRLRENTIRNKRYVIDLKILPYFGEKKLCDILPTDVRAWQNELMKKGYAETYLRTCQNQMSALMNHATKFFNLKENPCKKAGSMGKNRADADKMKIWTLDDFTQFIHAIMDKRRSYIAFMVLYHTGIREGELLALTLGDIDWNKKTLAINKSYQRYDKRDVITDPKTPESVRVIALPQFLLDDLKDYTSRIYGLESDDRIFPFTKNYLISEMKRGAAKSGVERITIHSLRHSHASRLISMGISVHLISKRLGHKNPNITLSTYIHLFPNQGAQVADELDSAHKEELNERT